MNLRKQAAGIETSALAGFLVSGLLFSLVGAMLPAWGYDLSSDFAEVGRHFLAITTGMLASAALVRRGPDGFSIQTLLVGGCGLAAIGLGALALLPGQFVWRVPGLLALGAGAGLLHAGLFSAILPAYENSPSRALNRGGIFFGLGSVLCASLAAAAFWANTVSTTLLTLAVVPAAFAVLYARRKYPPVGIVSHPQVLKQFRSGAAVLFSLLLFFQFGNEWAIAGWLPLFLIHRLGIGPVAALEILAAYFGALTLGRIAASLWMPAAHTFRVLAVSAASSCFGCVVLSVTDSRFGAGVSIAMIGLGFAAIYPVAAVRIGKRFRYYHPGFFNGIFSIALAGGMLAPWALGEAANHVGLWAIMTFPAIGTCAVLALIGLLWIEGRVTGE